MEEHPKRIKKEVIELDSEGNPVMIERLIPKLDDNNYPFMEDFLDYKGEPVMVDQYDTTKAYKCKEITVNDKKYRIAYIGVTYHCG